MSNITIEKNTALWDHYHNVIHSKKGGWKVGEDVVINGYSLFDTFMDGNHSWFELFFLSITGRKPTKELAQMIEAIWFCLSFPDPRIWCNRISALAGSMRCSPITAAAAASLASDSLMYGGRPAALSATFISNALKEKRQGKTIAQIINATKRNDIPVIPGFNRPITNGDMRVQKFRELHEKFGFEDGKHVKLAYKVHEFIEEHYGLALNVGGLIPAFFLDQGLTPLEIHRLYANAIVAGAMACYVDTSDRLEATFLPLKCSDILFRGKAHRKFPSR